MSYETDRAFIEDYEFMLANGESHETAAVRFGTNPNALEKRVWRTRQRLGNYERRAA